MRYKFVWILGALSWAGFLLACSTGVENDIETVPLSSAAESSSSATLLPPYRFTVPRPVGLEEALLRDTIAFVNADRSQRVFAVRDDVDSLASRRFLHYVIDYQGSRSDLKVDMAGSCAPAIVFWATNEYFIASDAVVDWCALRPLDAARVLELGLAGNYWEDASQLQGWSLSEQGDLQRLGATLDSGKLVPLPSRLRYALWERGRTGEFYLYSNGPCDMGCTMPNVHSLERFLSAQQLLALSAQSRGDGQISYFEPWLPRDRIIDLPRKPEVGELLWDAAAGVMSLNLRGTNLMNGTDYRVLMRMTVDGGAWETGRTYEVQVSRVQYGRIAGDLVEGEVEAQTLVVDSLVAGISYGRLQLPPDAPEKEWSFAQPYREGQVPMYFSP